MHVRHYLNRSGIVKWRDRELCSYLRVLLAWLDLETGIQNWNINQLLVLGILGIIQANLGLISLVFSAVGEVVDL